MAGGRVPVGDDVVSGRKRLALRRFQRAVKANGSQAAYGLLLGAPRGRKTQGPKAAGPKHRRAQTPHGPNTAGPGRRGARKPQGPSVLTHRHSLSDQVSAITGCRVRASRLVGFSAYWLLRLFGPAPSMLCAS